jgi:hypothetical protein
VFSKVVAITDFPLRSIMSFPGNLSELYLAGIIATIFKAVILIQKYI